MLNKKPKRKLVVNDIEHYGREKAATVENSKGKFLGYYITRVNVHFNELGNNVCGELKWPAFGWIVSGGYCGKADRGRPVLKTARKRIIGELISRARDGIYRETNGRFD